MNQTKRSEEFETSVPAEVDQSSAPTEPDTAQVAAEVLVEAEAPVERSARELELEAELEATRERLLRALAETENLRRRSARELEEAHKYAITGFARELLEVADNLSRALSSIPPRARDEIGFVKNLAEGVAMTEKSLLASFERHQIAKVVPEPGSKFDHNLHQAMLEIETAEHQPGAIAQVMQLGYVIADRLLRPALVGVAKPPSSRAEDQETAQTRGNGSQAAAQGEPEIDSKPGERLDTTA